MDAKELVEELFRLDEGIRWIGVADQQGNILQNIQRPDVESLTDKTTDELTLHVFPTVMGLLWGRLVGTGIRDQVCRCRIRTIVPDGVLHGRTAGGTDV